ncbi:hypothetical protein HF086_011203 [Spodoptera exigua]|uniref:Kazal-like domain-containing protein n=1 Tax=Spodoptera exigua TaxID=7107 RepID=A0A922MS62_SPOEX|nr:hypothetical protein HF086_011203 [Spodoptera exigua]
MAPACFQKVLSVLRKYVLKLKAFDLFLQGTYLLTLFLETNVYLLMRRDARAGYHSTLTIGALVAWWGKGKRNRAISGWLGLTAAAGLLVLAFPFAETNPVSMGLFPTLKRLITNKVLILQTIAMSCWSTAILVFAAYEIPYAQIIRINSSNRTEALTTKSAAVLALKASVFVTIFLSIITFTSCDTGIMKGLESGSYEQPSCSSSCGCTSERYGFHPVCMLETRETYFSPCHAGCNRIGDLNGISSWFHNARHGHTPFSATGRQGDGHGSQHICEMTCVYSSNGECLLHSNSIWYMSAISVALAILSGAGSFIVSKMRADNGDNEICEL